MFSLNPEPHAMEHVRERTEKLLLNNEVRIMELLESIQFGIGYLVISFFVGVTLDYSFPEYKEDVKTKTLFLEVVLQSLLVIIAVYYIRKIVKIMPFLFVLDFSGSGKSKYIPYEAKEYEGEVIIAMIFLGCQFNFIKKLDLLSRRFYKWLYNEEKHIGVSLGL